MASRGAPSTRRATLQRAARTLTLTRAALPAGLAGCAPRPVQPLQPATVEGPPRRYWLVEITRRATVTAAEAVVAEQGGCRYHVNAQGDFWGDHWGWCEDFQVLPRWSPGYLIATTLFAGATTGGYSRLLVLPPLPAVLAVFGQRLDVDRGPAAVLRLALGPWRVAVPPGQEAVVGSGEAGPALVEGPDEAGHVGDVDPRPVPARVTYAVHNYGDLDSPRIGGRRPVRP